MDIKNKGINKGLHEKTNEDNEKKTLFVMKKVKILVASVLFCAMGYVGYTTYKQMSMSDVERFMQANVEALTRGEGSSGTSIVTCLGLTNEECVTSAGDRSTAPLVRAEF